MSDGGVVSQVLTHPLAVFAILCLPGPTNALLAVHSATHVGRDRALKAIFLVLASYSISVGVLLIISAPLGSMTTVFDLLFKGILSAYLAILATRLWLVIGQVHSERPASVSATDIIVTTLLNPKVVVIVYALRRGDEWLQQLPARATLIAFAITISSLIWVIAGKLSARALGPRSRVLPRLGAVVLGLIACSLAADVAGMLLQDFVSKAS